MSSTKDACGHTHIMIVDDGSVSKGTDSLALAFVERLLLKLLQGQRLKHRIFDRLTRAVLVFLQKSVYLVDRY